MGYFWLFYKFVDCFANSFSLEASVFQLDQKKVHAYVYLLLSFVWHNHFYDIYHMYGSGGGLVTKSCPTLVTPWTGACQAPLEFPRREY